MEPASASSMGAKVSHFSQEEVSVYEACTCLDGAELATLYATFISMGGRRVPKGAEESVYRFVVGQKTVKNMTAGADVAISQVRAHRSHTSAPACSRLRAALTHPPRSPGPAQVQVDSTRKSQAHKATETQKVTKKQVCDLPEFDNNPFATRLCEVFSSDGESTPRLPRCSQQAGPPRPVRTGVPREHLTTTGASFSLTTH